VLLLVRRRVLAATDRLQRTPPPKTLRPANGGRAAHINRARRARSCFSNNARRAAAWKGSLMRCRRSNDAFINDFIDATVSGNGVVAVAVVVAHGGRCALTGSTARHLLDPGRGSIVLRHSLLRQNLSSAPRDTWRGVVAGAIAIITRVKLLWRTAWRVNAFHRSVLPSAVVMKGFVA
jgi:hypothetical protein